MAEESNATASPQTPSRAPTSPYPFDAEALNHSRPIRWDRAAITESGRAAISTVLAQLEATEDRHRARRPQDQQRLHGTLAATLLDLYAAAKADPTRFLAYSRNANDFDHGRYDNRLVTLTAVQTVTAFLNTSGLTEGAPGYHDRTPGPFGGPSGRGRRTRVRATPRLVAMLEDAGLSTAAIGQLRTTENVRLKAAAPGHRQTKPLIDYTDTAETNGFRAVLAEVNALIAATRIDLDLPALSGPLTALEGPDEEDRPDANDRTARQLYRVFNNSRFDQGGRFYGGFWQSLRKEDRKHILIDGEPTVELDFKSMHPRLCYQFENKTLAPDVDPYLIPALPPSSRWLVKAALTRLLNAAPGKTPRAPEGASEALPPRMKWARFLWHIADHHRPIAPWFRSGQGLRLQYLDSAIADKVLAYLTLRGTPCLPVHDSFIVPASRERQLGETMFSAYYGQCGKHGAAKVHPVITGWSSPTMEALVKGSMQGG